MPNFYMSAVPVALAAAKDAVATLTVYGQLQLPSHLVKTAAFIRYELSLGYVYYLYSCAFFCPTVQLTFLY